MQLFSEDRFKISSNFDLCDNRRYLNNRQQAPTGTDDFSYDGMSLRALFWSRLAVGVLFVVFFIVYVVQHKKYRSDYAYLADKYSKLVTHSDGLSAQLQREFV
ncbi:unnamed protein product [Gongylonema pulchrum]|uniref:Sensor histidine kinase n=1 Tax=Gongylonema pulchrum TaxID=637853 RepID=A0A183E8D8_9BILA|nr:unnamed protein product [Gongylonema pulchrum]